MTRPKISVIIPAYNAEGFIAEAVSSALAQSWGNLEVLVVDDGSTDGTGKECAKLALDGKIRYFATKNRGPNAARNTGIAQAQGAYLALLDADDLWEPEKLLQQMSVFSEHAGTGMVFCDYSTFDATGTLAAGKTGCLFRETEPQTFDKLFVRNNFILPSTVVVGRNVFDLCGAFDESLRGAEDYEMWLRIARSFAIRGVNQSLARIREHPGNSSKQVKSMYDNELLVIALQEPLVSAQRYRSRVAKVNYLAADKMVCGGKRFGSLRYFRRGFALAPLLVVDQAVIVIRMLLGQRAVEKIRRWLNQTTAPRFLFDQLFKRF